ncbi:hypothetical protein R0J89_23360, partial [Psychrobacter sp. SIMBA_152]
KTLEVTQAITASETEVKNHVSQELGAHSVIKSIQRGTEEVINDNYGTIYLGDIDLSKSTLNILNRKDALQYAGLQ